MLKNKGILQVHIAVLLFGLSGLFGKLIGLPAIIITLGRVFFSSTFLFLLLKIRKQPIKANSKKDLLLFSLCGAILALHWWTFLSSIQVSTVAIGTISFSTFPLFVALLSPLFTKESIKFESIVLSIFMILGVAIMIEDWSLGNSTALGVCLGLISAITYALLSLFNKNFTQNYQSAKISFYEQGFAFLVLLPSLFILQPTFSNSDIIYTALLGVVFTGISHTLFINGLKTVKPQTAGIISGLETIYSIVFAFILFREIPNVRSLIGGGIILSVVLYSTFKENKA